MSDHCKLAFFDIVLVLFISSTVVASPTRIRTKNEIDVYARAVDKYVAHNKKRAVAFADVSDYGSAAENWKNVGTWDELDKFTDENSVYKMALLWRQRNRITAANFTFTSPSGDWNQYVNHVFRPNGSVALVSSELRTFTNSCVVKQKFYFDQTGKRFLRTVKYFDLQTNKPKKPCLGSESTVFAHYAAVTKLPFAVLLN